MEHTVWICWELAMSEHVWKRLYEFLSPIPMKKII
jgi:hypothetical protein